MIIKALWIECFVLTLALIRLTETDYCCCRCSWFGEFKVRRKKHLFLSGRDNFFGALMKRSYLQNLEYEKNIPQVIILLHQYSFFLPRFFVMCDWDGYLIMCSAQIIVFYVRNCNEMNLVKLLYSVQLLLCPWMKNGRNTVILIRASCSPPVFWFGWFRVVIIIYLMIRRPPLSS